MATCRQSVEARLKRHLARIQGESLPEAPYTVRALARRYQLSQRDLVELVEGDPELDLLVGVRCGNGTAAYERLGDCQVEYLQPAAEEDG